ncbi:hypothetical protein RUND412_011409, partial [Rhizina undulata]
MDTGMKIIYLSLDIYPSGVKILDVLEDDAELTGAHRSHFQFLTIIGLSLATLTFVVGMVADLTLSSTLFSIKNASAVASAPLEVLIGVLYWGICA